MAFKSAIRFPPRHTVIDCKHGVIIKINSRLQSQKENDIGKFIPSKPENDVYTFCPMAGGGLQIIEGV